MTATSTRRIAVAGVGLLTAVPIAVGFIVSWGALRDSALAAHTAPSAARLYPLGVDGLIAVALVAALVLRHDRQARRYCLAVLAAFTASSLVLNIAHGQGDIAPGEPLAWQLATLVSAQAVAAIGFGCHLLVHVLRAWFPVLAGDTAARGNAARRAVTKPHTKTTGAPAAGTPAPLGAGAGALTRHRGDSNGSGNAAVLRLQRNGAASALATNRISGSKTAAIRQYRHKVLSVEGREPTSKEAAAATEASERMARKVLAELRSAEPASADAEATDTDKSDRSIDEEEVS